MILRVDWLVDMPERAKLSYGLAFAWSMPYIDSRSTSFLLLPFNWLDFARLSFGLLFINIGPEPSTVLFIIGELIFAPISCVMLIYRTFLFLT